MPVKALTFMALSLFLAAGIVRAQEDTSVPAGGRTVSGRVVDAQGRPLPGVEIWRPHTLQEKLGRAERRPAAVSGPDGLFTVADLRPREELTACPDGWVPAEVQPEDTAGKPFEIRLQPSARMAGRVVDGRGEPVPGVSVTAQRAGWSTGCVILSPPEPCLGNPRYRSGSTDAEGRFIFEGLEPGWFEIRASDGTDPRLVRWEAVAGKNGGEVEVVLSGKLVPVEGRVVDADGKPVRGAQVRVSGAQPPSEELTGETGTYRFPRVFPGTQRIDVSHPDLGWIHQEIEIGGSAHRFDIRMPPASLVQGRILGRDGSPVAKPRLAADYGSPVELDAENRFRLNLSKGEHVVRVDALGWLTAERPVTATGDPIELDIELSRPATVTGRVTGLPPGERATLELQEGPQTRFGGKGSNEDGRFDLYLVAPGAWTLVASDSNGRTLKRRIQVEEGQTLTVEDFQFPPLPTLRGRVLDPGGQAARGALLTFQQERRWFRAVADAEGRFTAHLAEGTWTVKAELKGFGSAAATVTMAGAPAEMPDLRLARLVAVSGYVRGLAPGEIPLVQAASEDGIWKLGALAEQDHRFQLPDLWPGTWTVTAMLDGHQASAQVRILPADTAVRVDLAFEGDAP
jgi:hypothetical protein